VVKICHVLGDGHRGAKAVGDLAVGGIIGRFGRHGAIPSLGLAERH
jgi:hypothetical protein